jgi:hypothetical protein
MTALLLPTGRYDRGAIMRKAHAEFRAAKRRGHAWSFARCLAFAWAIAREQRARLAARRNWRAAPERHEIPQGLFSYSRHGEGTRHGGA